MKKKNQKSRTRVGEAVAALAVVAGSVVLAAPSFAADTNIDLTATNQFDQANITVAEGDTVTFTWRGGFHDVVFADGVSSGPPVGIDGTTFSRTFDAAGTYDYVCTVHESAGMVGTVTVQGVTAETTTAPADQSTATTAAPAAESTATTVAPSSGSGSNAAPTGSASAGGGAATSQPFTGPERSLLPATGLALMFGGVVIRLRLRGTG